MAKVGVVIGASADTIHAIQVAQKNNIYVYALDGNPNAEGLKYADESFVIDISDVDKLCEEIERIKPDFVLPIPIGKMLSMIGYINEKFHLPGIKYRPTLVSADKYLFHEVLHKSGLRDVELQLVNKGQLCQPISYPAIMKPRYGSGSRDVIYISSDVDLEKANRFLERVDEDFVLEQAVRGEEYSLDGAVINGALQVSLIRKKVITPLPMRQPIASYSIDYENPTYARVREKVQAAVTVLGYDNCLLNVDMIINDEEVFLIEMAPRPSGHSMHSVFVPLSTGVDMIQEYISFINGATFGFKGDYVRKLKISFFDFEDCIVEYVPTEKELSKKSNMILWNCKIAVGEKMNRVTNGASIMGRGYFINEGDSEADLDNQSNWVKSQFVLRRV